MEKKARQTFSAQWNILLKLKFFLLAAMRLAVDVSSDNIFVFIEITRRVFTITSVVNQKWAGLIKFLRWYSSILPVKRA